MSKVIIVTIAAVESAAIGRTSDTSAPIYRGDSDTGDLYLVSPAPGGGWFVEAWTERADQPPHVRIAVLPDTGELATQIASSLHAIWQTTRDEG